MTLPIKLDKSKGFAFEIDLCYLDKPIKFYHGLYSKESYAAEYKGNLVYLSGVACICCKGGREEIARNRIASIIIGKGLI